MKRRASLLLLGAAAVAPPLAARAQKAMPVVGWLNAGGLGPNTPYIAEFHRGLAETGFVEGQNVAVEYRWADDRYDRVPAPAADLAQRKVDVIATIGTLATVNAARKAVGATIPIVFGTGGDPVALGLVASVARPEGNLTGMSYLVTELGPKRLDLLVQAVPRAKRIALLVNPQNLNSERNARDTQAAATSRGVELLVFKAATEGEIDEAFAAMVKGGVGAVVIQADPFIHSRRAQLLALEARLAVPAIYTWREFAAEGGLMSYGPDLREVYRQIGSYIGRILKGAKPADLPVVQPTGLYLVVNMKTAKAPGLAMPPAILAGADEVIE
jgi:putative tryptophan/tyrosine transport system substrate-binding protein